MKTNPSARRIRKLQNTIFCLGVIALSGIIFTLSQSLRTEFGQITVCQNGNVLAPRIDLGAVMTAMP